MEHQAQVQAQPTKYFKEHWLLVEETVRVQGGTLNHWCNWCNLLSDEIKYAFKAKVLVLATPCDPNKPLNCVLLSILLEKLSHYGISGAVLKTLTSYLENRQQVVSMGGATSRPFHVPHGVLRDSVLGTLLFLTVANGHALLYTNDTLVMTRGKEIDGHNWLSGFNFRSI